MEFNIGGKSYKFRLNPEEYSQAEPFRAQITQTKNGAWVDAFGPGIGTLSIKGTTGFKGTSNDPTVGYDKFVELRALVRKYMNNAKNGKDISDLKFLVYNFTDGDYWVVVPQEFRLLRSVNRPLMYMYDIQLNLLNPISSPRGRSSNGSGLKTMKRKLG